MILVTGATGNAGGAVMRALADAGEPVRALVRDANTVLPRSVEAVVGDLNRPETFASALEGVSALFLLSGYQNLSATLANARKAGVEQIVLLSSSAAPGGDMSNAVARYHILSERAVRESGLAWTFLQPNSFMTNTLQWKPQLQAGDTIRAPFADVPIATIDPDDVGAVAAAALTAPTHNGHAYRLSGPQPLLPGDRVAVLANVLGRDLRFEGQSHEQARTEMSRTMPSEYVDAFMSFFADGTVDESQVLPTVGRITGRPPRTFEQWAKAHRDAFG
jgi:uncharacterized protein YbjT (DUF2867 family)